LSSSSSFISRVRLIEKQMTGATVVRHDDPSDLLSIVPACHVSEVGMLHPEGSVTLALRVKFTDAADKISLGPLGLDALVGNSFRDINLRALYRREDQAAFLREHFAARVRGL
jgi:hypothetical protein